MISFASALAPITWYYWLHQGSGNANFYYATGILYNVAQIVIVLDVMRAHIWGEVVAANPTIHPDDLYQK